MADNLLQLTPGVSRRTVLGGAALALALAQAKFSASAQEATPASLSRANHAIVGAWSMITNPGATDEGKSVSIFAETGLYVDLLWDRNVSLGEWRPIDDRTVELLIFTKWLIPFDTHFAPEGEDVAVPDVILTSEMGTARALVQVGLDDTGALFFMNGSVELYDEAGTYIRNFGYWATGERMTVAAPAATPTP